MGPTKLTGWKSIPLLVSAILMGFVSQANAQDEFDTVIQFRGKLKDFRGNVLNVTREDGTDIAVMLHEDPTKFVFAAEAKPKWLQKGMLVRIEANFGPEKAPITPVDTIELFQPFKTSKESWGLRERYLPGIYSLDQKPGNEAGEQAGYQPGNYRVIGMLADMNPNGILISAGDTQVPIQIAADAKWLIRYHNLSLAEPGDIVQVTGFHKAGDETKVKAGDVRVVVDRIFGEGTEKGPKRKPTKRMPGEKMPGDKGAAKP